MEDNRRNAGSGRTLMAAALGAAVGAAAVILSDPVKRQRIRSRIDQERGRVELKTQEMQTKAEELKEKGRGKLIESLENAKQKLMSASPNNHVNRS